MFAYIKVLEERKHISCNILTCLCKVKDYREAFNCISKLKLLKHVFQNIQTTSLVT